MSQLRLPDLVVLGARKCGTTWLDRMLRQHPDLYLSTRTKEIFFFDRYWDRGLGWYARHFEEAGSRRVAEVTPSYFSSEVAVGRLKQVLPEAKLVVVLRDPVERAWSDYLHARRKSDVTESFCRAITELPTILSESRYAEHLERWTERFGRRAVRVVFFEELVAAPAEELGAITSWLELPRFDGWAVGGAENPARAPRSVVLSRAAHRASRAAHAAGLHQLVSVVKRSGLLGLIEKPAEAELSDGLREKIRSHVMKDVSRLEELIGRAVPPSW